MDLTNLEPTKVSPSLAGKNFLFYGEPGTRKTSVACKFPTPLVVQTENGTKFINGVYTVLITNWNEAVQLRRELEKEEVRAKFETIVFDRIDTLYGLCYDYVLKQLDITDPSQLGYGAAWTAIKKEWNKFINVIENQNYGNIFICHDKDILNKKMEVIGTKIQLENTGAIAIRGLTDFIINLKKEEGSVYAYTNLDNVETKSRAPYLASRFEFTFENLEKELSLAVQKQQTMEGIILEVKENKKIEQRSFEDIRDSVATKFKELMTSKSPHLQEVGDVIKRQIPDYKITEAPPMYYEQMLVIETYILSLG